MDVVFLDANVLFSAAYAPDTGLRRRLWDRSDAELLTSRYAVEEARRNLPDHEQAQRLEALLGDIRIVGEAVDVSLPEDVTLPPKDRPILQAAVAAGASHLITGDVTHFGPYFGRAVAGVRILTPAQYLGGGSKG